MTCDLINKAVMKQNCIEALNQHAQPLKRKLLSRVSPVLLLLLLLRVSPLLLFFIFLFFIPQVV